MTGTKLTLIGDTTALKSLWADELVILVPQMRPMAKADAISFWRMASFKITAYETSALQFVRSDSTHARVEGIMNRVRLIGDRKIEERWHFQKLYVFRAERWQVTRWEARYVSK